MHEYWPLSLTHHGFVLYSVVSGSNPACGNRETDNLSQYDHSFQKRNGDASFDFIHEDVMSLICLLACTFVQNKAIADLKHTCHQIYVQFLLLPPKL